MNELRRILEINKIANNGSIKLFTIAVISLCITLIEAIGVGSIYPLYKMQMDGTIRINIKNMSPIEISALILVAIFLVKMVAGIYLNWMQSQYIFGTIQRLGTILLSKEITKSLKDFAMGGPAKLNQSVINDVDLFSNTTLVAFTGLVADGLYLIGLMFLIFYIDVTAAVSLLIISAVSYLLIASKKLLRSEELGEKRRKYEVKRSTIVKDIFFGIIPIKLSRHTKEWILNYDEVNKKLSKVLARQYFGVTFSRYILEFIGVAGVLGLMIYYAIYKKMILEEIMANLGVIGFVGMRLAPTLSRINQSIKSLQYTRNTVIEIYENLKLKHKIVKKSNIGNISKIEFRNVELKINNKTIINKINIDLQKGESLMIKGRSGSGKTTIIKLLLGIEEPSSGEVLVNGVKVDSDFIDLYKEKIAYVDQNIEVIEGSIAENISMKKSSNDYEKIHKIIESLNMKFVYDFEEGVRSKISKHTILSGGQKQKISIARAFYDKEIELIILDEATSALDEQSSIEIKNFIRNYKDAILIEISHKEEVHNNYNEILSI